MKCGRISATTALDGARQGKRLDASAAVQVLRMHHTGCLDGFAVCASRHPSVMLLDTAQLQGTKC